MKIDKKAIQNKDIPLRYYNYSYVKDRLETKYKQKVSLPTIIDRARKNDLYIPKKRKKRVHDREVLTNYAGELIQHDSSHHLWAPAAKEKWYLITSIDDFSRYMLYAVLIRRENVTDIKILNQELRRYNHRQVHSTTQEVPYVRFQKALNENNSLFREFKILPPYLSTKDIFCLRTNRTIDAYRKISINNLKLKINKAVPRENVNLRIYLLNKSLSEVRFWCNYVLKYNVSYKKKRGYFYFL